MSVPAARLGIEIDLTLEQFQRGESLRNAQVKQRPAGPLPPPY